MADEDAAIANLAADLNAESKSRRRKKADAPAEVEPAPEPQATAHPPGRPELGDSWLSTDGKTRYWHGQGWYLSKPDEAGAAAAPAADPPEAEALPVDEPEDILPESSEVVPEAEEPIGEPISEATAAQAKRFDPPEVEEPVEVPEVAKASPIEQTEAEDEGEHPGVARIEFAAESFDPDPREAVQGLRDFVIETIKQLDKPYHLMTEERQVDLIRATEYATEEAVRKVVELIAARGQQPVRVLLKKLSAGDKIQITGEVSLIGPDNPDDALLLLHHAIGKHVMVTRATVDDYKQGGEAEIIPDEPEIDFESDSLVGDDD